MKPGRKGLGHEMRLKERFSELSEPYFLALKGFLESDEKADQKFAIEQLTKAYSKMMPTEITGEDGKPIIIHLAKEIAETEDLNEPTSDPSTDSNGQA